MKRHGVLGVQIIFALFIVALQSCTPKKNTETSSTSQLTTADESKKIFAFARADDPRSLDPQGQLDELSATFIQSLYDTLVDYHYLIRPYKLVPSLLSTMPVLSSDGLTYTFTLKPHVHFSDDACFDGGKGRELKSDDVIYTLKRFADANVNAQSWFFLSGAIVGLDELHEKTKTTTVDVGKEEVVGIQKVSDYVFTIQMKQKNPLILFSFASSALSIVPHEAVEKYEKDFSQHPVGTGAFTLKEYSKKQTMVFLKNPNYHMTYPTEGEESDRIEGRLVSAGQKIPFLDEVHLEYIPEAQPEVLKFKKGDLAWVGLDKDNFGQMVQVDDKGQFTLKSELASSFELYTEPALDLGYISINMKDPLLGKNRDLRKAIAYAIDVNKQIALLRNGRGTKLYSVVPLAIAGSEKDIGKYWYDYDPNLAKEHLVKAGFPEGKGLPPIEIILSGSTVAVRDGFEFLRENLAQIGITLVANYKTWPSFLKAQEQGDFQLSSSGWAADYPDAENFYQLFYSGSDAQNSTAFQNDEYNALYSEMRFMENSPERFSKIKRMAEILKEEVPVIIDSNALITGLTQKWVRNFKRNVMLSRPFKYFDIDVAQKKLM